MPQRFLFLLKPPPSKSFNPFPSLSRENATPQFYRLQVKALNLSSPNLQTQRWLTAQLLQALPKCLLLLLYPAQHPRSSPPTPLPAPQQTTNNKIATETPREINGSAYSDCKWGSGKGGTDSTGCQVGISFVCCCFSSYKALAERCKQLAPWNSTRRGGWSSLKPEAGDNRGHESSNKHREQATPSLICWITWLMRLSEAATLETNPNSLPSHFTWQESSVLVTHHTWGSAAIATG